MMTKIGLDRAQIEDLRVVLSIGPSGLTKIANHLAALPALPLKPSTLLGEMAIALEGRNHEAASLLRPVLALAGIITQRDVSANQLADGLYEGILGGSDWSEDDLQHWKSSIEPPLVEIIQTAAVKLVAKATDLSYDYANLFQASRVITDIRPVFDDSAETVLGHVISFTLRLSYDNKQGDCDLSVAMDERDIKSLLRQCERAIQKAALLRQKLNDAATVPIVVSGEDAEYDND